MAKKKPGEFPKQRFQHKKNNPIVKPTFKHKRKPENEPVAEKKPTKADFEAKRNELMKEREKKLKESKKQRTQRNKVMYKKTRRGQPMMKDRIQYLLNKIQASQ